MGNEHLRLTVSRRARVRDELKPMKVPWLRQAVEPDWAAIAHVTGEKGYDLFELLLLKRTAATCAGPRFSTRGASVMNIGSMSYDTLRIAKAQAHAELGLEYVEWAPCDVEITEEDGSLSWEKALPLAELGVTSNGGRSKPPGSPEVGEAPPSVG